VEQRRKTIDIEEIIKGKNPRLYSLLPRFVLNYIKRKLHEDAVNDCLWINRNKYGLEFNQACLDFVGATVSWEGLENIPANGGVIVAANHPLGGLDGMALVHAVGQRRKDCRFIVNDILTNMKNFGDVFIGVNKVGASPGETLRAVEALYESSQCVAIFPAGLVSRKQSGVIKDLEWKKSFITKAIQYNKPVVPAYIGGRNSNFFYNFALWRKRLGIKANIEMFFLADEMIKQRGQHIRIKFGAPIYPEALEKPRPRTHFQYAQEIKELVYAMAPPAGQSSKD
jgi:1-acyl-sn-glycerol-3-phosphate acyltransferase